MSELQWLAVATAVLAVVCYVISGHDRYLALRWWRRRRAKREKPWSNLLLTALPGVLILVAIALAIAGRQPEPHRNSPPSIATPR